MTAKKKKITQEIVKAGSIYFIRTFSAVDRKRETSRARRHTPSTSDVIKCNDKNAERKILILINHNFTPLDWYITLTYKGRVPDPQTAKRELDKFIRRLAHMYRKHDAVLKWVSTTEHKTQRTNHHLVISGAEKSGISREDIIALWHHGHMRIEHLYSDRDYRNLAAYLIKETAKEFRSPDAISKRRYGRSRNCSYPEARRNLVKEDELYEPKIPKGYYLDADSWYMGINPITGRIYSEYVILPLEQKTNYWKWSRLKKTRPQTLGFEQWLRENSMEQQIFDI